MTRDEVIDFLEWAQDCGQLQFPESRKVDMAEMYIKDKKVVNTTCNIQHVGNNEVEVCCANCGHLNNKNGPCNSCFMHNKWKPQQTDC